MRTRATSLGAWREHLVVAAKKGLLSSYPDQTFRPNQPITHAEMAAILGRINQNTPWIWEHEVRGRVVSVGDDEITVAPWWGWLPKPISFPSGFRRGRGPALPFGIRPEPTWADRPAASSGASREASLGVGGPMDPYPGNHRTASARAAQDSSGVGRCSDTS